MSSAAKIPTSTSLTESAVIPYPLDEVWHLIKLKSIPKFWSIVSAAEDVNVQEEVHAAKWTFKDGTSATVKLEEHSSIDHFITYSVIDSEPALGYSSLLSQIRLFPVTSGDNEGHTFVQWSAQFSGDAGIVSVQDARYKRKDGLKDLAKALAEGKGKARA
ncbi:polyketide cyclase/dehydrase and lipid transport domain-containing protein [Ceratobasidium sp. AG-Ba]|nr:polyketide cyclase/dehydrase and lipid transport domain-containing protein [Ceratobasidium sp. AG-Ba]